MIGLKLPKLGSTMDEGMIVAWHVAPGDTVRTGDVLYEVTTDKVNMDVEADKPLTVVELLVPVGSSVAVGAEVALVETDEDPAVDVPNLESWSRTDGGKGRVETFHDEPPKTGPVSIRSLDASMVRASPASRQLARQLGVDLNTVDGTGPRGRITPGDVTAHHRAHAASPEIISHGPELPTAWKGPRAVVAQRMTQSAQIPQVTLTMAVDMRSAIAVRQQWVSQGTKISLIDLVLLAVARMLTRVPTLNGWAEHGQFVAASAVDLGYAIDVPNKGLYVVTLPAAQALTLEQIAEGRRLRTERVLHGKATLEDLGKPSFTVSNLGPMGVETFNPLLMPPQVGILGVGTVRSTPTEDRLMLSLTFDHRVIDGAPAAGALKQVKEGLEFPGLLL